MSICM